jgi:hypothetical protein
MKKGLLAQSFFFTQNLIPFMANLQKIPYIRVGTTYYKKIKHPLASRDFISRLVIWKASTIRQDESQDYLAKVPKYDSFCTIPSHLDYKQEVGSSYNKYEPFEHKPVSGDCQKTIEFMNHIFGDQFELGMDYLKLLLEKPLQMLPVLCLVSSERNTGKTTYLNYLRAVYGGNMTINTNEDFRSQFNSDWATKLIIGVDEVLLDRMEDSEKIKNLSTSKSYKVEAKGVDKSEGDFFGKFILCSNNEETFIKVDSEEIRYWIRKVPVLLSENINLLGELIAEIPQFLFYLKERKFSTQCNSRMWFTPAQIYTEALDKVMRNNKSNLEKELRHLIEEQLLDFDVDQICFTNGELLEILNDRKANRHTLAKILKDKLKIEPNSAPSTYVRYSWMIGRDGNDVLSEEKRKGRYYTFKKQDFVNSL